MSGHLDLSHHVDPELFTSTYIGWELMVFTGFFVPLQVFAVALRFYARYSIRTKFGLDDRLCCVSLALQMAIAGIGVSAARTGVVGYHVGYLHDTNSHAVTDWKKYLFAMSSLYPITVTIPKLAICALYHRLFPQKKVAIVIYVVAGFLVASCIAITIATLAACQPVDANWAPLSEQAKHCVDKEMLSVWGGLPNILSDVALLILPLPIVWKLQCTIRLKVALSLTFIVGSLGLITSIFRFHSFFNNNSFTDSTYFAIELLIWSEVEPGIYLICACLPTYRPILEKLGIARLTSRINRSLQSKSRSGDRPGVQTIGGGRRNHLGSHPRSEGFQELDDMSESYSAKPGYGNRTFVTTDGHEHV